MHVPTILASQFDADASNGDRFLYLYVKVIIIIIDVHPHENHGSFCGKNQYDKMYQIGKLNISKEKNAIHTIFSLDR